MSNLPDSQEPTNPIPLKKIILLYRDTDGLLKAKLEGKEQSLNVKPIRCFPLSYPDNYIELYKIESDGTTKQEIALISELNKISDESKRLLDEEVAKKSFITEIKKIYSIKLISKVWIWKVETANGSQTVRIKNLEDIYMIKPTLVTIKDAENKRFLINLAKLDSKSQSLIEMCI